MTSGKFKTVPINEIVVVRTERIRKEIRQSNIDELAASIHRRGLIHPPVVTEELKLVSGETRLTACKALGWTAIPVQFVSDLSERELKLIELEENVKRKNLSWQDECLAVYELHKLHKEVDEKWTQQKTAEVVGFTQPHVGKQIEVAEELLAENVKVTTADKFSVAYNAVQRSTERKKALALTQVEERMEATLGVGKPKVEAEKPVIPLMLANFHEWQDNYKGQKFNLIHCDFPYGINISDGPRQNSVIKDVYDDTPETYWSLVSRLSLAMKNVVAESAHLIFWFSMDFYSDTLTELRRMGWTVDPYPLIWNKSDNAGIASDPQRKPRRVYECAFFGSRGDRKLTEAGTRSNSVSYPGQKKEGDHVSTKPIPVLEHFMKMVCDEYSIVFDPTAGSGNALKVGKKLGAKSCLGLEINKEFYERAIEHWSVDDET